MAVTAAMVALLGAGHLGPAVCVVIVAVWLRRWVQSGGPARVAARHSRPN